MAGELTEAAITRAVREYERGETLILYVSGGDEDRARRALGTVRPQTGDERNRPGAQDAMVDGRRVYVEVDPDLDGGEWSLSHKVSG